jgi:MtN3 and saliva related transmembrane protein
MFENGLTWTSALGTAAMVLSVTSFAPQALKIIRSRDTSALSAKMYAITVAGFVCWLGYGLLSADWPIVISNAICGSVAAFILVMKLLPQEQKDKVSDTLTPSDH